MKPYFKTALLSAVCCTMAIASFAQTGNGNPGRPEGGNRKEMTPESIAKQKVDRLDDKLGLDDKQEAKLYKFFCKQEKQLQKSISENAQEGGPRPPMGEGMPPQMGGGRPGGMPQMGGGRPPMGERPQGDRPQGERPQMNGNPNGEFTQGEVPPGYEKMLENEEKTDKMLQKVLTADQYSRWKKMNERRK